MNKIIDIAEIERAERRRINWDAVHIAGDRNPPLKIGTIRTGRYSGSDTVRRGQ